MDTPAIPNALKAEFATVEALWALAAATRNVDALIFTWLKYEKQARRLFSFLCCSIQPSRALRDTQSLLQS